MGAKEVQVVIPLRGIKPLGCICFSLVLTVFLVVAFGSPVCPEHGFVIVKSEVGASGALGDWGIGPVEYRFYFENRAYAYVVVDLDVFRSHAEGDFFDGDV